ncbi:hemolysin III family protein [Hamadaea sp. NPDC050747]|uniref:PAQR family membrane homeostasis protein TrhA n=1 Tax=Hamadaea sp. NPDC050747 TaxID=3155789 RepID=UPI0033D5F90C
MTADLKQKLKPTDIGKPRLRGWLHAYAFFIALACGAVLITLAAFQPGIAPVVSVAIYSVTVCGLFGISALYHRRVWSERGYQIMRRLDHAMIFIFIAGTYTPFCVLLLDQSKATVLLLIVWAGAIAGAAVSLIWPHAPRWVSAPMYIALGWVAVAVLPDILHNGGVVALVLLLAGGLAYTVGAVFYALRRPNPWPTVFGHHEFFHACTLVAALCHQIAVYFALYA